MKKLFTILFCLCLFSCNKGIIVIPKGETKDTSIVTPIRTNIILLVLGVPDGSTLSDGAFTAWVSSANTVKVRFTNNSLTLALDPASGTFKVRVMQ